MNGKMVYRGYRHTKDGVEEYFRDVAHWIGHITERVTQISDDGGIEHFVTLDLIGQETKTIQLSSETFGHDTKLRKEIAGRAGEAFLVEPYMGRHLASAIVELSGQYPHHTVLRAMGWTEHNGAMVYAALGLCLTADGPLANGPSVQLENRLNNYNLFWPTDEQWPDCVTAFAAAIETFPKSLAPALIGFIILPIMQRFFPAAAPKPAIHITGTYQSGKSEIGAMMNSFYGMFTRDDPPAQWGDTVNNVEALGYPLASALYWVDDYKTIYADERSFTRFLQSYSRGMGRGLLTRDAKIRQDRPCRGTLVTTGETVLEGEASVLSRMLVLEVQPWEQRDPGGKVLAHAAKLRHLLPGFTARFIQWIARKAEQENLANTLSQEFATTSNGYRQQSNTGRIIQNWAVLLIVYRYVRQFLEEEYDPDEYSNFFPHWQDVIGQNLQLVRQERASDTFLNIPNQLLASGSARLEELTPALSFDPAPGVTTVGYRDRDYVYLLPELSLQVVQRVQSLHFTTAAIVQQLREDGLLIPGNQAGRLTIQMRIAGARPWLWRLKPEVFDGPTSQS